MLTALVALLVPASVAIIFALFIGAGTLIGHPTLADVFIGVLAVFTLGLGPLASWTLIVSVPYGIARNILGQLVWNWVWLRKKLVAAHFLTEAHGHHKPTVEQKRQAKSLPYMLWRLTVMNVAILPATALAAMAYYKAVHNHETLGNEWFVAIAVTGLVGFLTEAFIVRSRNRKEAAAHDAHGDGHHAAPAHAHAASPAGPIHREPFRGTPMDFGHAPTKKGEGESKKGKGGTGSGGRPKRSRGGARTS